MAGPWPWKLNVAPWTLSELNRRAQRFHSWWLPQPGTNKQGTLSQSSYRWGVPCKDVQRRGGNCDAGRDVTLLYFIALQSIKIDET